MTFIEFVMLHSNLLLYWHGFRDVNVTVNVGICWRKQSCFCGCLVNLTFCNTTYDWPINHSPPNIIPAQLLIWTTQNQFTQSSRKSRIRRIFTPTFGFVRIIFLLGILIYANFFLLTRLKLLKNTWRRQQESKFGFLPQKIRRLPLMRCPRVCHKMSSGRTAVGVISFSSRPIRTSHRDCTASLLTEQ